MFGESTSPALWIRIVVVHERSVRGVKGGMVEREWTERRYLKAYQGELGDASWMSCRPQLEQFVERIRKRESTGVWIDAEVRQPILTRGSTFQKSIFDFCSGVRYPEAPYLLRI